MTLNNLERRIQRLHKVFKYADALLSQERVKMRTSKLAVKFTVSVFTARCTIVQSAVLRSHVVCPSVCPSVTLVI